MHATDTDPESARAGTMEAGNRIVLDTRMHATKSMISSRFHDHASRMQLFQAAPPHAPC